VNRLALHWQILIAMVIGAAVGIALNISASDFSADSPAQSAEKWSIRDSTERTTIEIVSNGTTTRYVISASQTDVETPAETTGVEVVKLSSFKELETKYPAVYQLFHAHGRSWARTVGDAGAAVGGLFLRLLRMVSIPLVISSLISGITGLGEASRLGRIFGRTMIYYVCTSMLAILTGMTLVNLIQPGMRGDSPIAAESSTEFEAEAETGAGSVIYEQVENLIPPNPFNAVVTDNFLAIIAFTMAFAICTVLVGGQTLETVSNIATAGFEVMMKMTTGIIRLAPFGILFLLLSVTATQGAGIFVSLGWYMLTVAIGLAIHACVTLPLILTFLAKRSPARFARDMSPALLTAFSSASSNGTLPVTMNCAETRAGISRRITSFFLPFGGSINQDGTALYEVIAVLFIAQLTPEVSLTFGDQLVIVFTALLVSIGAAGIPHAGLVMMLIILQAVGLPTEKQAIIIAVDRFLDMCRTTVNVWSDSCGCAVIAKLEEKWRGEETEPESAGMEDQP
jgi:Na+/H+-dicarboxylate symporter